MTRTLRSLVPVAVLAVLAALLTTGLAQPAFAAASKYAPLDRPGPKLTVKAKKLDASLTCKGKLRHSQLEPVLLSPATGVTVKENYSWNYMRAFDAEGRPWCAVDVPMHTLGDIQIAGEYLVHAIRTMHRRALRPIAVLGHSQGAMSMRWALRFWPDTRSMVDDIIGMAGDNHGTQALPKSGLRAPAASLQQSSKSDFIEALNSRTETFKGVSYTEIYTHTDEVVLPSTGKNPSSALHTGKGRITNVATQDLCPTDVYEHLSIGTVDPVAYALVIDALNHKGPAKPSRIATSVCTDVFQPGVDPLAAATYLSVLSGLPGLLSVPSPVSLVGVPTYTREPALRCYVFKRGC